VASPKYSTPGSDFGRVSVSVRWPVASSDAWEAPSMARVGAVGVLEVVRQAVAVEIGEIVGEARADFGGGKMRSSRQCGSVSP
jgi:hypothetical protein